MPGCEFFACPQQAVVPTPEGLGTSCSVQFPVSLQDISQSFDYLLQLDTLFLEVFHQGTPATVQ